MGEDRRKENPHIEKMFFKTIHKSSKYFIEQVSTIQGGPKVG